MIINTEKAVREAKRWEAAKIVVDTYRTEITYGVHGSRLTRFFKPETPLTAKVPDYIVADGHGATDCDCADFQKHGDFCKHTYAAQILKDAEEAAQVARLEELHQYEEVFA